MYCMKEVFNHEIQGVGGLTNLKGKFKAAIEIDRENHKVECYIISK